MMSSPAVNDSWKSISNAWGGGVQAHEHLGKFRQIYAKAMRLVEIHADLCWSHADLPIFINILKYIFANEGCGAGPGCLHVNLYKSTLMLSQFTQLHLESHNFANWMNLWKSMQMTTNDVIGLGRWNLGACKSKPTLRDLCKFMQICTNLRLIFELFYAMCSMTSAQQRINAKLPTLW